MSGQGLFFVAAIMFGLWLAIGLTIFVRSRGPRRPKGFRTIKQAPQGARERLRRNFSY